MRLHEQMMILGAKHEVESNRIALPHSVTLTADAEQSLDVFACSEMKSRVALAYKANHGDGLMVEDITTIASEKSEMVQLADVIAGAVNRKKNHTGPLGFKDEMAEMIIQGLDIQLAKGALPEVDATTWIYL